MRATGGDTEPPEHGLRRYHRELQKQQAQREAAEGGPGDSRRPREEHATHLRLDTIHRDTHLEHQDHQSIPGKVLFTRLKANNYIHIPGLDKSIMHY